jgi:hypothetical protein
MALSVGEAGAMLDDERPANRLSRDNRARAG